jgi:hypothetical protein
MILLLCVLHKYGLRRKYKLKVFLTCLLLAMASKKKVKKDKNKKGLPIFLV